jgi:hypothetical protein
MKRQKHREEAAVKSTVVGSRILSRVGRPVIFLSAVIAMLWWATPSDAAITPIYYACNGTQIYNSKGWPTGSCNGTRTILNQPSGTDRDANPSMSALIGYVYNTQEPGTEAMYFVCEKIVPPPPPKGGPLKPPYCSGRYHVTTTPDPFHYSQLIGYVYLTPVPGTVPSYFSCHATLGGNKAPWECPVDNSYGFYEEPLREPNKNWFVGYIYKTPPVHAHIFSPKFVIGSVIYVPPGQGPSSITYGRGTVTGTTLSTTDTWSNSASISVSADYQNSQGTTAGTVSLQAAFGNGGSTSESMAMVTNTTSSTTYRGPASNTINHDYDQVVIYLGVKLKAEVDYLENIQWSLDFSQVLSQGYAETGYPITVGCLRPNSSISAADCAGTINFLNWAGITPDDYPSILSANPLADPNVSQRPDPLRYVPLTSVNYFPDPTSSTTKFDLNNSTTTMNTSTTNHSYSVNVGLNIPILKISNTITFTSSSSISNSTGSNNSSSVTLSLPSAPYIGPATLFIYMDTIYKTFMFSFE